MGRGHFKIDTSDIISMLVERASQYLPNQSRVVSWEYEGTLDSVTLFVEDPSIPEGAEVVNPMIATAFIVKRKEQ